LVIGNANAGKTTILDKVSEDPQNLFFAAIGQLRPVVSVLEFLLESTAAREHLQMCMYSIADRPQ